MKKIRFAFERFVAEVEANEPEAIAKLEHARSGYHQAEVDLEPSLRFRLIKGVRENWEVWKNGRFLLDWSSLDEALLEVLDKIEWDLVLHNNHLLIIHGAVLETPEGAVLFPGKSHSGKTTIVRHLSQEADRVLLTDEYAVLHEDGTLTPINRVSRIRDNNRVRTLDWEAPIISKKKLSASSVIFSNYDKDLSGVHWSPITSGLGALELINNIVLDTYTKDHVQKLALFADKLTHWKGVRGDCLTTTGKDALEEAFQKVLFASQDRT